MSDYNQTTIALVIVLLGTGVVASLLAIAWTWVVHGTRPDQDAAFSLVRIFMGAASVFVAFALIYRYVLR